jgi:hypothetical protein
MLPVTATDRLQGSQHVVNKHRHTKGTESSEQARPSHLRYATIPFGTGNAPSAGFVGTIERTGRNGRQYNKQLVGGGGGVWTDSCPERSQRVQ